MKGLANYLVLNRDIVPNVYICTNVANDITKVNNRRVDRNAERDCHQPANSDFSANVTPKVHGEYVTQILKIKRLGIASSYIKQRKKGA